MANCYNFLKNKYKPTGLASIVSSVGLFFSYIFQLNSMPSLNSKIISFSEFTFTTSIATFQSSSSNSVKILLFFSSTFINSPILSRLALSLSSFEVSAKTCIITSYPCKISSLFSRRLLNASMNACFKVSS